MANRWYIHAVSVNGTYFSGITSYTMNGNVQKGIMGHDGQVDPTFAAVLEQKPDLVIRTCDLSGLIEAVGFNALPVTELIVWWQKGVSCGTRASGSVHLKATAALGCAVMRTIAPQHNQVCEAEVQIFVRSSNGIADPWVWTESQALGGTIAPVDHFTLGPVYVTPDGGSRTNIPVNDWSLDPGINAEPVSNDGVSFADYVRIDKREPKFECTTPDVELVGDFPMNGVVAATEFFLRKISPGTAGGRVANATEEHIKFTIADGLGTMDTLQGDHGSEASAKFSLDATYNGTNAIVVIDFTAAIA